MLRAWLAQVSIYWELTAFKHFNKRVCLFVLRVGFYSKIKNRVGKIRRTVYIESKTQAERGNLYCVWKDTYHYHIGKCPCDYGNVSVITKFKLQFLHLNESTVHKFKSSSLIKFKSSSSSRSCSCTYRARKSCLTYTKKRVRKKHECLVIIEVERISIKFFIRFINMLIVTLVPNALPFASPYVDLREEKFSLAQVSISKSEQKCAGDEYGAFCCIG